MMMTPLKYAVLHHKGDEIASIVERENEIITIEERQAMFKLACEIGNKLTKVRVARLLLPQEIATEQVAALLYEYMTAISSNYFGGGTVKGACHRAWAQAILEQAPPPFSRDEPDFILDAEKIKDIRWMFQRMGLNSLEQVVQFILNYRPNLSLNRTCLRQAG